MGKDLIGSESEPKLEVNTEPNPGTKENNNDENNSTEPMVYVKKWMKTRHAIMFRLSNKTVQVSFFDDTELIINSKKRGIIYTNKKKERNTYPLDEALSLTDCELTRRIKYTKDILLRMLSSNKKDDRNSLS